MEMVAISKRRAVPVISVCDEIMIGFDPGRLEQMLNCLENQTNVWSKRRRSSLRGGPDARLQRGHARFSVDSGELFGQSLTIHRPLKEF